MMLANVNDYPGLQDVLDDCTKKVESIIGVPVTVGFKLKFHFFSMESLATIICDVCEVSWSKVMSTTRKADIVIARQLFCYISYNYQKKSLNTIARYLNKDHTTVIHSNDRVRAMIETSDEIYMPLYNECLKRIDALNNETKVNP